jgi:hypothetical protein
MGRLFARKLIFPYVFKSNFHLVTVQTRGIVVESEQVRKIDDYTASPKIVII